MEKYYVATLHAISLIGHQSVKKLVEKFGSAENVWLAESSQLQNAGVNQRIIDNLINFRNQYPDAVEKLIKFCEVKKVKICTYYDEEYPTILKEISGAPVVFYYRGELKPDAERVSIVGTREPTPYGKNIARMLSEELAAAGFTIVSGAARGIDTLAHESALQAGRTVAVLGYGINKIPTDKQQLFEDILANGGVVMTEFPPNYNGDKNTFPARNRIIAGLSKSVIIVEAGEKSGALITAGFAADNSRDVFVIPHSIFSKKGAGCNKLIREGAILITCAADVLDLDYYNFDYKKTILKEVLQKAELQNKKYFDDVNMPQNYSIENTSQKIELEGKEKLVYEAIPQDDFITMDEILDQLEEIEPNEISEIILKLDIKKLIYENEGSYRRL